MRIGLVVPHIFMHRDILPRVIFSPAELALGLANGLQQLGTEVTLFSPGPVNTSATNVTADLSYFEQELVGRNDTYIELLKKHPLTFISLARQVQAELIAKAFEMANQDELDIVHIYTNEEDIALPFAALCRKPVVFTHHDPFNFSVKYKNNFPKYTHLNWLSMSYAQRAGMPKDTNWIGNIYHGLDVNRFRANLTPSGGYVAYLGRIIEPKGVHLAVQAVQEYNRHAVSKLVLKIAGKHYAGHAKDAYWSERIAPYIDGTEVQYVGYISSDKDKQDFLGNAEALVIPSTFQEPFGMVMLEAFACGTPVIGTDQGAIPEVIDDGKTGFIVPYRREAETQTIHDLAAALARRADINRASCRTDFEERFSLDRMVHEHLRAYEHLHYN